MERHENDNDTGMMMGSTRAVVAMLALLLSGEAVAQGFMTDNLANKKHRDFAGQPCLQAGSSAQPLTSDPRVFNHIVTVDNRCVERIKVRICYHDTDSCVDADVPGRSRKEAVIGVFPAMRTFQYDLKEQF